MAAARARLGPDELGVLEQYRGGGPYRPEPDALATAVRWKVLVDRFDSERRLPLSTYALRGVSDLSDALALRDAAEVAVVRLPEDVAVKFRAYLDAGDSAYQEWTVADSRAPLAADAEECARLAANSVSRAWWWFRRPTDGPIAKPFL